MPRPSVIAVHSRSLPVSPRRIAHTPNCIVKLEAMRIAVRTAASGRSRWPPSGGCQLSGPTEARALKYVAKRPPKNITSLAMKRSMPTIGVGMPVAWVGIGS